MNKPGPPLQNLSQAFQAFLDEQETRVGPATFSKYRTIIDLYQAYLERYWPGHDGEYDSVTRKGGTYCGTFGPEDAALGFGEFLDYFMPRKVLCGKETMQAAGTVTRKLAKWLSQKGYAHGGDTDR